MTTKATPKEQSPVPVEQERFLASLTSYREYQPPAPPEEAPPAGSAPGNKANSTMASRRNRYGKNTMSDKGMTRVGAR